MEQNANIAQVPLIGEQDNYFYYRPKKNITTQELAIIIHLFVMPSSVGIHKKSDLYTKLPKGVKRHFRKKDETKGDKI